MCSPHKRARIRAFFSNGIETLRVSWVVGSLPTLLHLSLSLFFAGLLIFLFNINHSVFIVGAGCVGLFAAIYTCITLFPIFKTDSRYYAPLSSTAWFVYASTRDETRKHIGDLRYQYKQWILGVVVKAAEDSAGNRSSDIDPLVLRSTFDSLSNDHSRERFFAAIPGFLTSNVVKDPQADLPLLFRYKFQQTLDDFLDRTLSSDFVTEPLKVRRLVICLNAAHVACGPAAVSRILDDIFEGRGHEVLQSVEMGHCLQRQSYIHHEPLAQYSRSIVSCIVASTQERDDRWLALAMDHLGLSEDTLRCYLSKGESVLLANLIYTLRLNLYSDYPSSHLLSSLCRFDIQLTLPGLQHDFCNLWNRIVLAAQNYGAYSDLVPILRQIHRMYVALHRGTDAAPTALSTSTDHHQDTLRQLFSYPLCTITDHHLGMILQTHTSQTPTTRLSLGEAPPEASQRYNLIPVSSRSPSSEGQPLPPHSLLDVASTGGTQDNADISAISFPVNPQYVSLPITQLPSWVQAPSTYKPGSYSLLFFSFEDPEGTQAGSLLCAKMLFLHGHVVTSSAGRTPLQNTKPPQTLLPQLPNHRSKCWPQPLLSRVDLHSHHTPQHYLSDLLCHSPNRFLRGI
ncbi:hypothetical protein F5148DRAFT_91124 [Russula earlei]|uniref:Uncharacterized protein n=1 Tax=Russula earlei TaxID=71964 RepID=A0ACC0U8F6_9AGAM|nr:hypothetical protein F5148DRAFT_91124 [Russula earlei]